MVKVFLHPDAQETAGKGERHPSAQGRTQRAKRQSLPNAEQGPGDRWHPEVLLAQLAEPFVNRRSNSA